MKKPLVSVIIVNFNGKKWLEKCLNSLTDQTYGNIEAIFVDNDSADDSVSYVSNNFPKTLIVENKTNLGFAGGNNVGFKKSKGEFLLLINNDTYFDKRFIENFMEAFKKIPNLGSVQSKIVLMDNPDKLDMAGAYWTDSSFLYYYGYGKDADLKKYNVPMPFFSNKGASMLIKRDVIEKIGLFDDDFFNYYEETDFCHRLWIAGYECWYWPKAVLYHAMGGTSLTFDNSYIQFHNFKNKLLSFLKNFEISSLIIILPAYFILNFLLSWFWLLTGKWKYFPVPYRAVFWNILNIKNTINKRKSVQSFRKKSDGEIFSITKKNPRLRYYSYLFTGKMEDYED